MFCSILSAALLGVDSRLVEVEADVSEGLPMFSMVGYLSSQVREAQDRVRTAIKNSGIRLQPKRITLNMSPADLRKEGTSFDLPIAIGILGAYGHLRPSSVENIMAAGELSLNGEIRPVRGVLPMALMAKESGCRLFLVPRENLKEAQAAGGIAAYGAGNLNEAIDIIEGRSILEKPQDEEGHQEGGWEGQKNDTEQLRHEREDFSDILGQEAGKRAAQIAMAGLHNILFIGPPGAGKSLIAKRLPTILPPMSEEEQLEVSKIYSIAGMLPKGEPLLKTRPFRAPHHTVTAQALAGGGRYPRPGEVSLAHRGVLFLDELAEFSSSTLEILRQPLEEHSIWIARMGGSCMFPARFVLAAAMNPCKCGYFPDLERCICTPGQVQRYLGRISQPLLERFDMCVEIPKAGYDDMLSAPPGEDSAGMRAKVCASMEIQEERYRGSAYRYNSDLDGEGISRYCAMDREAEEIMKSAFYRLDLSVRSYHHVIRTARTIADLEGSCIIRGGHAAEAVCYRSADRKYWNRGGIY